MAFLWLTALLFLKINTSEAVVKNLVYAKEGEQLMKACCPDSTKEYLSPPTWAINGSIYQSKNLPSDYIISINRNKSICYMLTIPKVKLWMDATTYSCYFWSTVKPKLSFTLMVSSFVDKQEQTFQVHQVQVNNPVSFIESPLIQNAGIDSNGNAYFCVNETHPVRVQDIIQYDVNITTSIEYSYETVISGGNTYNTYNACYSVPDTATIMKEVCGPHIITVKSINKFGSSLQDSFTINSKNTDKCECFKSNVKISTEVVNTTTSTAYVNIQCSTKKNETSKNETKLKIMVEPALLSSNMEAECYMLAEIKDLSPDTNYILHTAWEPEGREWICITDNYEEFHTKPEDLSITLLIEIGIPSFASVSIVFICSIVVIYAIRKQRRPQQQNRQQFERQDNLGPPQGGDNHEEVNDQRQQPQIEENMGGINNPRHEPHIEGNGNGNPDHERNSGSDGSN